MKPYEGKSSLISSHQELIIMVGYPASGKSSFVTKFLEPKGYHRINRDTLKTQSKCLNNARAALSQGKSVVIDNTNPDKASRLPYISLAKEYKIPTRCFLMSTPKNLAEHLNVYRESISYTERIPEIVYAKFKKKYEPPSETEGFVDIAIVNFVPDFKEDERSIFLQWT